MTNDTPHESERDDDHVDPRGARAERNGPGASDDGPPFGLPVLAEVPELAAVLEDLVSVDRLLARVLEGIIRLRDHSIAEAATGLPLERWLAGVARRTGSDRRMLATAATACRRLPSLRAAFSQGRVSWAQVRAVALQVERLPTLLDDRIDGAVGDAIAGAGDVDPDALRRVITWTLAEIEAEHHPDPPSGTPEADWLAMQPRLDGTGGQVHGDFSAEGFALIDGALNAADPPEGRTRAAMGADPEREAARATARQLARHRAERLKELCRSGGARPDAAREADVGADGLGACDTGAGDVREDAGVGTGDRERGIDPDVVGPVPPNQTILRAELDTLLSRAPAALLTRLTGGRLHVDAATARRLMDAYGTRLRVVLVDHGRVVGVGRSSRQPTGWLADAVLALHDTCSEPGCDVAARSCDLDHARPWSDRGGTDLDQLAPVCATANHDKEGAGWTVEQRADGVRVWTHERSGLATRTVPATWRPPPRGPTSSEGRGPDPTVDGDPPDDRGETSAGGPEPSAGGPDPPGELPF